MGLRQTWLSVRKWFNMDSGNTDKLRLVHFTLGSLEVYSIVDMVMTRPIDNYYWADASSPQGYGPFYHLGACMDHYKLIVSGMKDTPEPPKGDLIRVDFARKRRI